MAIFRLLFHSRAVVGPIFVDISYIGQGVLRAGGLLKEKKSYVKSARISSRKSNDEAIILWLHCGKLKRTYFKREKDYIRCTFYDR